MLFVDQRDYFQQQERKVDLQKLEAKKQYYQQEIAKAKKTLTDLQSNPAALEKFARERYLMKKDGEEIFTVEVLLPFVDEFHVSQALPVSTNFILAFNNE